MRVLAIDSSGLTATVAIVEDDTTIAEFTINYKKTHSQTLLPMIDEMVKMVEADLNTIDAIAVAGGPGSFTGLRIGSATAKGLGGARGAGRGLVSSPPVRWHTVSTDARILYVRSWMQEEIRFIQESTLLFRKRRVKIPNTDR